MTQLNDADPIWGPMPASVHTWADGGRDVTAARAGGRYRLVGSVLPAMAQLSAAERALLTTHIVDANRLAGDEPPVITTDTLRRVRAGRRPNVVWQMDRLLAYLAHAGHRPGRPIPWLGTHVQTPGTVRSQQEAAWIGAEREDELSAFRHLLEGAGLMKSDGQNTSVTAAGFVRMDELHRGAIATDQVFVAMWFGSEMEGIYDDAIAPAIRQTGYQPVRIDRKEHLNKIDDEIIAVIGRATEPRRLIRKSTRISSNVIATLQRLRN